MKNSDVLESHHLMFVMNLVVWFCMRWSVCIWWCEILLRRNVGKVTVGNKVALYNLNLLCTVRFFIFL